MWDVKTAIQKNTFKYVLIGCVFFPDSFHVQNSGRWWLRHKEIQRSKKSQSTEAHGEFAQKKRLGWFGETFFDSTHFASFCHEKNGFFKGKQHDTNFSNRRDLVAWDSWHPMAWSVFSKMVIVLSFVRTLERYNESILRSPHFEWFCCMIEFVW